MCSAARHAVPGGWHVAEAVQYGATVGVAGDEIYVARHGGMVPLKDLRSRVINIQREAENLMYNVLTTNSECCDMGEVNSDRCNICRKAAVCAQFVLDPECLLTPRVRKPNGIYIEHEKLIIKKRCI